ncbi:hypothetical protein [Pseudomonas sp. TH21]|uniref:hypothetical protein n=1 Tax=Pseudomonas sp. TH21 TaxID=2796387 RepID=UPI001F5B2E9D|nr:hypothetical protein [Pseudomonas sp. TH21]
MPNLICTDSVDQSLIEQFSVDGVGFPDHAMLNPETGELDASVLERMIGMSRALRRIEQAKVKPGSRVMDFQKTSIGRLKLLLRDLFNIQQRLLKKSKRIDGYRSWERVVLNDIDPTWHELKGAVAERFGELTQEDQDTLSTMLEKRLGWVDNGKNWEAGLKDFIKGRTYVNQLGGMVGILLDQLAKWDRLSNDERRALADGVYALATPFGNELLGVFLTCQPELMGYYSTMLEDVRKARQVGEIASLDEVDQAETAVEPPAVDASAAPLSLYDLYTELFQLAERAKSDLGNLHYAEQIEALITSNLPRLKEEYSLSDDAVRKILGECIDVLIKIGRELSLQDFDDEEFLIAFRAAWLEFFNERLQDEVPETFLADLTEEREVGSVTIKTRLDEEQARCVQIESDLADFNERLKVANFREKGELRSSITEAEESRVRSIRLHQEVEQQGCDLLLPPGYQLDTLSADGQDVDLTPEAFHPSTKAAITAWSRPSFDDLATFALPDQPDTQSKILAGDVSAITAVDLDADGIDAGDEEPVAPDEPQQMAVSEPAPEPKPLTESEINVAFDPAVNPVYQVEEQEVASDPTFISIENDVADESATQQATEDEVKVSRFFSQPKEALERLEHCQQTMNVVPAIAVENIALLWMKRGQLPMASKTLEIAGRMGLAGDLLSLPLVQAAYHGMHVWRGDSATVTRVQQNLHQLSSEVIESWIYRRPGGRVVPYLVLAATLQPTLFFGMMTNAPRLLASVLGNFDGPVSRLIEEVVNFSSHNTRLDVDTLREQPTSNDKEARDKLAARLVEWQDRILNKQTGWAPARKAMKECLAREDFDLTYESITKDDASRIDEVRAFADLYRDKDEQSRLMTAEIHKMMNESTSAPQIEGNAKNWFLRSIDEIVDVADRWVEGHSLLGRRTSEVSKFAPRFLTMLTAASAHLEQRLQNTEDPEQQAGLLLAINVLQRINKVAERHEETIWEISRINGWLQWPSEWLATSPDDNPHHQLALLTSLLEKGVSDLELADQALERKNFRHALLLTLNHEDVHKGSMAENIEAIKRSFSEDVRQCNLRSDQIRGLLDNANIASLIDDERHYQLRGELEHLQDQLKSLKALDDIGEIHHSLDTLESSIATKFTTKKQELEASLDSLVNQALVDRGVDWIPAVWQEQIRSALNTHDTTVAEEMLEHLKHSLDKGEALQSDTESGTELLKRFLLLEPQLHSMLSQNRNPREVIRHVSSASLKGLSLDTLPAYYKLAIEDLISLRRRVKSLDKATYEELVRILYALGLEAVTPSFSNATSQRTAFSSRSHIAHLTLNVKRHDTGRGIVFFNQKSEEQAINVLIANGEWTLTELRTLLTEQTQFLHERTVLISAKELSNDERNELAKFSKQQKHALLHVDPVLMTMLAGLNVSDHQRLKTFLQLSLPWTFSNPYTGNQMQPAPPEMRYGRQKDIKSLTTMRNGAAMIFGGRQLGKTTLLNETQRLFNNPGQRRHAFLYQMDGDLDRANLSGNELEKNRYRVWQSIHNAAVTSGLVKNSYPSDADGMVDELRNYFSKDNPDALMVCLDEIDPILGLDAANGFRIFRELSGLVNNSNGRFKVVIAGLENVRRFADAPNYPLHQLGSAIQVSIMSPAEALQLIREPLGHLGYEFESPLLMNRILVETNRHPGLIHIVCHELIQTLNARHNRRVGSVTITAEDIEQIRKDPNIRQLICDRFDITLNLDLRYKLIAYSLISQSTSSFSPSRAKLIVQEWAPHIFEPMTDAQFEAFLDELCGLGVLQYMRRTEGGKEYALRNTNIMNLVGGQQNIEDKLLAAVDAINENDPLSAHAYPVNATRPSPLTLRDEKLLISEEVREKPTFGAIEARSSNYSVGIITGSEALGLDPQWMLESLLAIGEEEPALTTNQNSGRYVPAHKRDTDLGSASEFKKLLVESVIGVQSLRKNIMFFVEITGEQPISLTLDLLDVAHEARLNTNAKRNRVRVIFLMSPRALWQWESNPQLTQGRETMQPFIALDVWKKTAMAHLLNKLNLENTSTSTNTLESYSQGWYFSLDRLLAAKKKKSDVVKVSGFGAAYTSVLQAKPKSMEEFLGKTGVTAVSWGRQVLSALCEQERFDEEDIELQLMDDYGDVDPQQALRWLTRLRLIVPCRVAKKNFYRIPESIKAALLSKAPQEAKA